MFMVSWIKQFANKCGGILPFGDSNQTEIRLPLGNKNLVHQIYCEALEKNWTGAKKLWPHHHYFSDVTIIFCCYGSARNRCEFLWSVLGSWNFNGIATIAHFVWGRPISSFEPSDFNRRWIAWKIISNVMILIRKSNSPALARLI
jgi:hypothetical protein